MILIFLLLFVSSISADEVCDELNTTAVSTLETINILWNWCLSDSDCVDSFYQDHQNLTVFNFLAKPIAAQYGSVDEPYDTLFCNKTKEEAVKNLWLLLLRAYRTETKICDINHILVVDKDQLKSTCVCRGDRVCRDVSDTLGSFKVMYILFLVIGVIVAILLAIILKMNIDTSRLTKKKTEKKEDNSSASFFSQTVKKRNKSMP
jgi:hypothetical protein